MLPSDPAPVGVRGDPLRFALPGASAEVKRIWSRQFPVFPVRS